MKRLWPILIAVMLIGTGAGLVLHSSHEIILYHPDLTLPTSAGCGRSRDAADNFQDRR